MKDELNHIANYVYSEYPLLVLISALGLISSSIYFHWRLKTKGEDLKGEGREIPERIE